MKRTLFLVFGVFFAAWSAFAQEVPTAPYLPTQSQLAQQTHAPITVQYPYENMTVPHGAKKIFIFGQVNLPQPTHLTINGQKVKLYKNGAFVAYVPVASGDFTFFLEAANATQTVQALRHIRVPGSDIQSFEGKAAFDPEAVFPQHPLEIMVGDTLSLYARGTPGAKVTAHLAGIKNGKTITLKEDSSHPGVYRAQLEILPTQKGKTTKVVYKMTDGPDRSKAKITAPAKVTVQDADVPFRYAQVLKNGVKLRKLPTASGNLYPDYRAYGVVRFNAQRAKQYRLWLSDTESAWLETKHLQEIKHYEESPNVLSFIRTDITPQRTRITFTLNHPVPIKIHEYKDSLELTLYYIDGFEQNFSLDDTSPVVSNIQWRQPDAHTLSFRVQLRKENKLWGHAYDFEGNQLVLDLIHSPVPAAQPNKPLAGTRIVLDAGHSPRRTVPYDGAIGPTGYLEYEGTLALAEELKPLLEQDGATVIMTRQADNRMTLQQRYEKALEQNAHIFVSLHYNALPDTANPFARPRGFSVYYNYPHSFALAQAVYQAFTRHVPLPDNGLINNDVLFIPRIPQFPSILVENAYLILPEQEQMARTAHGRAAFVKALHEGILNFYAPKQADLPPKRTKPRR